VRDFNAPPGRLRILSPGAKVLYTAFAIATLVGLWVSFELYGVAVGDEGPRAYYAAEVTVEETAPPSPEAPASDGPVLELPEEATSPRVLRERISERKLLEVTHFHLFSTPLLVLVLAHLWLLASLPRWLHLGGVIVAVGATAVHLAAPWLVRGREALAPLVAVSAVSMLVALGVMAVVPAVDMWLPLRKPDD
jgi:hypothetical protein